jgi:hypothetical protein
MTSTRGMSGPACREIRQLLGVYIVGAIDPAERSVVDEHLESCWDCREELSGLAGLPALLGRVPLADAERLAAAGNGLPEMNEPPAELLNGLLRRVAARRRARRWRSVLTLAAAVAIAAGGTAGVVSALEPGTPQQAAETVTATGPGVMAQIRYSATSLGGTAMRVGVMGIQPGTHCTFWVIGPNGERKQAATWTIGRGYAEHWYWISSQVPTSDVDGFQITAHGKLLASATAS